MKRLIILATTMLLAADLLAQSVTVINAAPPIMTCEQARNACYAQLEAEYDSCVILGGGAQECMCRALRIYNSCMVAHGCPSGKQDLEGAGCPDNN